MYEEIPGAQVRMDFHRGEGFYAASFPGEDLRRGDGSVDMTGFPNPDGNWFVKRVLRILSRDADGFGLTSAVFFGVTGSVRQDALPGLAESLVAGRSCEMPHILMLQGIVDTYIPPPVANAASLSLGLDLAGEALDVEHPDRWDVRPLVELLPFSGRQRVDLPVAGNRVATGCDPVTAVVVQHPEDGVEDGHEVVFQTEPPKRQYRCFLETFALGIPPRIPHAGE